MGVEITPLIANCLYTGLATDTGCFRFSSTTANTHIVAAKLILAGVQVSYFKATHGKRIFKMAPIHHHFELCGWSETRVVAVFSVVTAIMCLIALLAL